jgi:hypothetical protein
MTETTTSPPKPKQKLSSAQMLHLMRLEADRAIRHEYAISCMVIGLDGYSDGELREHRRTLLPAVFHQLKEVTFHNDVRGLGVWTEQFLFAVFPHVTPERIGELAAEMIERAANVPPPFEGAPPVTLSIGISHNLHPGPMSFEYLVEEAETGMGLASSGGNRVVQARDVEREIDRLREEVERQIAEIDGHQDSVFGADTRQEDSWAQNLVQSAIELFEREPDQSEGVLRLQKEVIALIKSELERWRNSSTVTKLLDNQSQVELLERRVAKLTDSLGITENALNKVAGMKNIDLGVASIYRTVQGLSSDDDQAEQKSAMLQSIFEANLELQGKSAS